MIPCNSMTLGIFVLASDRVLPVSATPVPVYRYNVHRYDRYTGTSRTGTKVGNTGTLQPERAKKSRTGLPVSLVPVYRYEKLTGRPDLRYSPWPTGAPARPPATPAAREGPRRDQRRHAATETNPDQGSRAQIVSCQIIQNSRTIQFKKDSEGSFRKDRGCSPKKSRRRKLYTKIWTWRIMSASAAQQPPRLCCCLKREDLP